MLVSVCLQFKCPHYTRKTQAIKRYNWHLQLSPKGEHMNNMTIQVSTLVSVKVTVCYRMTPYSLGRYQRNQVLPSSLLH